MSQEPSVLLVDLPDRGAPFAHALTQVGRPSVFIPPEQVANVLERGRPLGIVALARDVSQIAACIRAQGYPNQLPFFVLQEEAPGSIRPPLPEVTAVVPEAVEPRILALRIQQALQQIDGPRPRLATVLGMGSMSKPQELPSKAPVKPQSTLIGGIQVEKTAPALAPGAMVSTTPPAPLAAAAVPSTPPPVPSTPPPIPSRSATSPSTPPEVHGTPPEVPWDDVPQGGIVSSAPPAVPKSQPSAPRPTAQPVVVSSAPPLPDIRSLTPSLPFIPEAAPLSAESQRTLGELSSSPDSSPPPANPSAPTHPPVAMNPHTFPAESDSEWEDELRGFKKRSWGRRTLAAAGLLAAIGVGAVVVSGGMQNKAKKAEEETSSLAPGAAAGTTIGSSAPKNGPKPEDVTKTANEDPGANESPDVTGEAALYKVESSSSTASCETALGKSAADFASEKKWRASQSWKQARKSLMAGQEESALKYMCEASFIDASGPATIGLAKYYLGRRGLEEAHSWATKALDAAPGANSKRTAQQVLGDVLSQMGKVDEARSLWLQSFNLTADDVGRLAPVVRNFISAAAQARKGGDPRLAEQLLRRATTFEPENANASGLLAAVLLENGEKKLAKAWAERALLKKPGLDTAEEVLKSLGG